MDPQWIENGPKVSSPPHPVTNRREELPKKRKGCHRVSVNNVSFHGH